MDTSTHFVMGVGLFGLAHIDPTLTMHPQTATAVLAATVIGSQLPDTDGLYRFKSPAEYVRNHRGWTHSLPMIIVWPLLLTLLLSLFFPEADKERVLLWSGIAVFIHVFIDLFNTYGTQAFRPFSRQWISWNILSIFDPFIFGIHLMGFLLWGLTSIHPSSIFMSVYFLMIAYVLWRTWVHYRLTGWIKSQVHTKGRITVTPTIRWNVWNVIAESEQEVQIGEIRSRHLLWTGYISTGALSHPAVEKSKEAEAIDAFLSFTSYGYPLVYKRSFGHEVRWLDVRYHYKKHFPFVAGAFLDETYSHLVTRALGVEPGVQAELAWHPLQAGDGLLLCSDGLSDMLDEAGLSRLLDPDAPLQPTAQALVEAANQAGGRDNISLVLIRALGPAVPARRWWSRRRG